MVRLSFPLVAFALITLAACRPSDGLVGCESDDQCNRGQVCEILENECVEREVNLSSTCTPGDAEYPCPTGTTVLVPFYRGQLCSPTAVPEGGPIPLTLLPCVDPCITVNSFKRKHFFNCIGSSCEGWAMLYMEGTTNGCTGSEWGGFPASDECYLDVNGDMEPGIDFTIDSVERDDGTAIAGKMTFEIPYLSNADIAEIAMFEDPPTDLIRDLIDKYPLDTTKRTRLIDLGPGSAPPEACMGSNNGCTCTNIAL